jgi:hypothetical protein
MTGLKKIRHIPRWLNVMTDYRDDIPNYQQSNQCDNYDGPDFIPILFSLLFGLLAIQLIL